MRNTWLRANLKRWYYCCRPGDHCFRYFGTRVFFEPGSHIFERICEENIYERGSLRVISAFLRPDSCYLDIGANIGVTSIPILRDFPQCRVVSFEPSPSALPLLRKTHGESPYQTRWGIIGKALGAQSGVADFFVSKPGFSAFDGLRDTRRHGSRQVAEVEVTTLDAEWKALGSPLITVIKLDVEGAELDVLLGGTECLRVCRPAIYLEWNEANLQSYHCPPERILGWAETHGYHLHSADGAVLMRTALQLKLAMIGTESFLLLPSEQQVASASQA